MSTHDRRDANTSDTTARVRRLLTVKEYADVARQHPQSVYRRIRAGHQVGVHRCGGSIRLDPPDDGETDD